MRLYVSDLDFTLANSSKKLSVFTRSAINLLYQHNIMFTIATARAMESLQPILGRVQLHLPIIQYNGGIITDYKTGKNLVINALSSDIFQKIWELNETKPMISTIKNNVKRLYYRETNQGIRKFIDNRKKIGDKRLQQFTNIDQILTENILALTYIDRKEIIADLYVKLQKITGISMHMYENEYSPGWWWITIHDEQSTKGNAIKQMMVLSSIENFKVTVFGDNVNDISMFKVADRKIAVRNAAKSLLEQADIIIDSNDTDSVMRFILEENNL